MASSRSLLRDDPKPMRDRAAELATRAFERLTGRPTYQRINKGTVTMSENTAQARPRPATAPARAPDYTLPANLSIEVGKPKQPEPPTQDVDPVPEQESVTHVRLILFNRGFGQGWLMVQGDGEAPLAAGSDRDGAIRAMSLWYTKQLGG